MEQEYTGINDRFTNRIYVGSIVRSSRNKFYMIKRDPHLQFVLIDLYSRMIEKLSPEISQSLIVLPDETEVRYDHI